MKNLLTLAISATLAFAASANDDAHGVGRRPDFGQKVESLAKAHAISLFGVAGTLNSSSSTQLTAVDAEANPAGLLTVAHGLRVSVVSADPALAPNIDQMAFWPNEKGPTHIIACNEQGDGQVGVQSIEIASGAVHNIISSGLTNCDPARRTPWGTIIVGEEAGVNGRIFEILDPLNTTAVTITGAGASTVSSDQTHVAYRGALGMMSFEGIGILPNGVVYITDENRPGGSSTFGNPGGAIIKFIPSILWTPGAPAIADLNNSPWVDGTLWGMRLGRNGDNTDVGQGNEFGRGVWVQVPTSSDAEPTNLRSAANTLKLTSYYRPEDMSVDPKALADGKVRFCGTNTGQDVPVSSSSSSDNHWGEVYCVTDGTIAEAASIITATQTVTVNGVSTNFTLNTASIPEYHPLIIGSKELAMPDNLDIQPRTGNFIIDEDDDAPSDTPPRNNDIFACLDDGADTDQLSDGCVRVMTLNDLTAEPTGGTFDASGRNYYVSTTSRDTA